ncbi:transposase (fragment) [Xenorhabdus bovienii SS-2004]|uniref:Transposase n=2 Tax=Xenorhabdus bovienii TaxID=40576 RepID=D3UZC5_XENBS
MKVSRSTFYAWQAKPVRLLSDEQQALNRKATALFKESRESLGYRMLAKKLRKEGLTISDYRTRELMNQRGLSVRQRQRYRAPRKDKAISTACNLLNRNFNPLAPNEVWAGDITYLKTPEGWLSLAIVMDLYSRRTVGWQISTEIDTTLISQALMNAYYLT